MGKSNSECKNGCSVTGSLPDCNVPVLSPADLCCLNPFGSNSPSPVAALKSVATVPPLETLLPLFSLVSAPSDSQLSLPPGNCERNLSTRNIVCHFSISLLYSICNYLFSQLHVLLALS